VLAQFEDSKAKLSSTQDGMENEVRDLKKKLVLKTDQHEVLEKEFAKLQDKYRDV